MISLLRPPFLESALLLLYNLTSSCTSVKLLDPSSHFCCLFLPPKAVSIPCILSAVFRIHVLDPPHNAHCPPWSCGCGAARAMRKSITHTEGRHNQTSKRTSPTNNDGRRQDSTCSQILGRRQTRRYRKKDQCARESCDPWILKREGLSLWCPGSRVVHVLKRKCPICLVEEEKTV
jgi:hypothetical protein